MERDRTIMEEGSHHRRPFHRRALSDTAFRGGFLAGDGENDNGEDDLLFDPSDIDDLTLTFDLFPTTTATEQSANPGVPRLTPMAVDSGQEGTSSNGPNPPPNLPRPRPISHFRSLSVDSDFFDGLAVNTAAAASAVGDDQFGGTRRYHHQKSSSMDGTTSFDLEAILAAVNKDSSKKAIGMSPDRLAELALVDPKKAKRIIANRQSAARSKERRVKYTNELEKKVQTLQNEATSLSAQVTKLQRDTTDLTAENQQLKLRLQAMEQQAYLRDALHEALREEIQRLKIAATPVSTVGGNHLSGTQCLHFMSQPRK